MPQKNTKLSATAAMQPYQQTNTYYSLSFDNI